MIVLIDNYDSFTYNLVQYFQILEHDITVYKNDELEISDVLALNPDQLVISPGPNSPNEAGISMDIIKHCHKDIPILGVCLGHQCLAQAFGGKIIQAPEIIHGKTSRIEHHYQGLFHNIPNHFQATRYHSLTVDIPSLPDCLSIDAWAHGIIMAISHRNYPLYGLQFHPEAILSEHGLTLLDNFIKNPKRPQNQNVENL